MGAPANKSQSNNTNNSMQRVKVYLLNEDGKWDERGTGHVVFEYVEHTDEELGLCVIDEEDKETLLVHPISPEDIYRRQEDSIISWREPGSSTEFGLSFQESAGCSYVWNQICTTQRNLKFNSLIRENPLPKDCEEYQSILRILNEDLPMYGENGVPALLTNLTNLRIL